MVRYPEAPQRDLFTLPLMYTLGKIIACGANMKAEFWVVRRKVVPSTDIDYKTNFQQEEADEQSKEKKTNNRKES